MSVDSLAGDTSPQPRPAWLKEPPYALITAMVLLAVWQFVCSFGRVPDYLLPSPYQIGRDLIFNFAYFIPHSVSTALVVLWGFIASVAIGVPIAGMLSYSRVLNKSLYPLIVGSQVVPKVAIAPLMLAWFGFGMTPKIAIVITIAFFPVVINAVVGLRSASPQMVFLAQSMGASIWQMFVRFYLPNALPHIFAGVKMAAVLAVIGAVVAEFVGSDKGLGYVILVASSNFNITRQFSAIFLLSLLGMIFFWVIELIERRIIPWHVSVRIKI
jgi:NitT/TauT family transport system permease protein